MRALLRLVAHELPARWRGWTMLVLVIAIAGGRRAGRGLTGYDAALARQPGVAAVAPFVGLNVQPLEPGGRLPARPPASRAGGRHPRHPFLRGPGH